MFRQEGGMHSSIVSKIEKARTYAEERGRVGITTFSATFRGNHNSYQVSYDEGAWGCSCPFFASRNLCSHTMALQRILEGMLSKEEEPGRV
jgi:hypothetical protein